MASSQRHNPQQESRASSVAAFLDYLRHELGRTPLTIEAYGRDLNEFVAFITDGRSDEFDPLSVTLSDIRSWVASLGMPTAGHDGRKKPGDNAVRGESPATLRRKVQTLRSYFRYLMRRGLREDNPAAEVVVPRLPHHLPDFVRDSEMEDLLNLADPLQDADPTAETVRDHLIIEILYSTGLRQAELLSLTDEDIYFSTGELRVTGKRGKTRIVPMAQQLLDRIREWQRIRDQRWPDLPTPRALIATARGAMSKSMLYNIVHRMLGGTASGRKSPHTLRHTFATSMLNGGADLEDVKDFLGHTSLSTTQIYTHVSFAEMRRVYASSHPRASIEKK